MTLGAKSARRPMPAVVFLLAAAAVAAAPRTLILGEDDRWGDVRESERVAFVEGKRGYLDLTIHDTGATVGPDTDMLLGYEGSHAEGAGKYLLVGGDRVTKPRAARRGSGGGVFVGNPEGVVYLPTTFAAFAPHQTWDELSIGFWLYPVQLDEGATVFGWRGSQTSNESIRLKEIRVSFSGRALSWRFVNLFTPPDFSAYSFEIRGADVLVPRQWRYHLLRFRSDTGLVEYLIDGVTVAADHVTVSGHEESEVFEAYTGNDDDSKVVVGAGYTGFIDDLEVRSAFVDEPVPPRYPDYPATAVTRVFDLGYANSRLLAIDADYRTPGNSTVLFYYRIGETLGSETTVAGSWIPYPPGVDLRDADRGRYLQLLFELLPDGAGELAPLLHTVSIEYEPDLPPHPPGEIRATAGDSRLTVAWRRYLDPDVAGYLVYYGDQSLRYFGTDSDSGASPIDAGDARQLTLTGLENGKLYYVAVVAYDGNTPPQQSEFSEEASARPTRVFGTD